METAQAVGELGQSITRSSQQVEQAYERGREKARSQALLDRSTALERRFTDRTQGMAQPDSQEAGDAAFEGRAPGQGLFTLRGKNAVEQSVPTYQSLEEYAAKLGADDDDEETKAAWQQVAKKQLSRYYDSIETHASREGERARADSLKNATDEAIRAASMNPADDAQARANIARIVAGQDAFATSTEDAMMRAEAARGAVTKQRLDALLAQPGGFNDAERVFKDNRSSLGALADDYEKRIAAAKAGGFAIAEADRIVAQAMPAPGSPAEFNYRMPNEAVMYAELQKLPPEQQKLVLPTMMQRLALAKANIKEKRDEFIDSAKARYNLVHGGFFGSDMANKLNRVDPDAYRALWNETQTLARRAGDDSAQARREQKADNELLMLAYKNAGDLEDRLKVNVDTFAAGSGADKLGVERVRAQQQQDKKLATAGLGGKESDFIEKALADARGRAPPQGATQASKAAYRAWWAERKAAAVDIFADWQLAHPGAKPTPAEISQMRADAFAGIPVDPKNQKSLDDNVRAQVDRVAGKTVELVGPKGERIVGPAGKELDQWLATHPGWKRK